ncbi:defensin-7-like [Lepus europaeus]|uniref:defensin-7-like n=1 Tax=Lepus europaeus TaxID=9983 RepID=UPI002B46B4F7|nr:defensin-7-like [Lepus europaeus]
MRTFTLLTAILLVALQAKTEPVPPKADEAPDQEWSEAGDQVINISFAGDEMFALQDPGKRLQQGRATETKEEVLEEGSGIQSWMV